ncbi:hypothetical protein ACFSTH_14850 [Paenibacillus yanchengensis]|uniref:DUF3794 domain-containing protein n=1 Tax=Paenibacillus yanchengensis TaxID=2035833 RepID=A0ABW4YEP7_9BACL
MEKTDACLTNEAVLVQSVLCSKKVNLIAFEHKSLHKIKKEIIQFIPDLTSIKLNTTLLKDMIIVQGFIVGNIIIDERVVIKTTLSFQEEVICEGVCPGDVVKHTTPVLVGVLPAQVIPGDSTFDDVVFKVVLSTQVTVIREKLGTISVNLMGDINEHRCETPTNTGLVVFENTECINEQECVESE